MNDNDITKLLKVCSTASGCKSCRFADSTDCAGEVSAAALDLINRQKAEIERLTLENSKLAETNNALNYQIDTWSPSEAIKAFVERLKNKSDYCYFGNIDSLVYRILEKDLNALVEEMTEGRSGDEC